MRPRWYEAGPERFASDVAVTASALIAVVLNSLEELKRLVATSCARQEDHPLWIWNCVGRSSTPRRIRVRESCILSTTRRAVPGRTFARPAGPAEQAEPVHRGRARPSQRSVGRNLHNRLQNVCEFIID